MTLPASCRPQLVVVTLAAREVELALAPMVDGPARVEERLRPRVDRDLDRQAARLARDVGGQRQQLPALVGERRRALPVDPAGVDALLEVDRPPRAASNAGWRAATPFMLARASPWQSAQARPAGPVFRVHSAPPSSTQSMPGLAVSSSCIARVSRLMKS